MKPPYASGSVPSLSGHAIAYRWRSLPRVRQHRASKLQGSSEREMTVKPKLSCLHAEEARVTRASVVSRGVTMRQVQVDVDKNCGVLSTALPGRDGQHLQQKVQNRRLQKGAVVWSDGYKNCGVLCTGRTGRDGQRLQQKVQNRRLWKGVVIWSCRYKHCGVLCSARTGRDGQRQEQKV